jgi:Lrp/AsnC family leucine-responsive transcriptional regulator
MNRKPKATEAYDRSEIQLDATDLRLLEELQHDGRITWAELGRRVSMTAPAVRERVARLERAGVIAGYQASIDGARLGWGICAFVRIAVPIPSRMQRLLDHLEALPQAIEAHTLTGDDSLLVKLLAGTPAELDRITTSLSQYGATSTSIVLSSPIDRRPIAPRG